MYNSMNELKSACLNCNSCKLCENRHNVVFGIGNETSEIMFIGEGPGENEDLMSEPFVGKAGKLLDKLLNSIHLDRNKNIYIANIVKCRPPQNRDPQQDEQDKCIKWLREQTSLIKPKIIVCLGRIAALKIIDPNIKITKDHGQFFEKNGIIFMPTLHPAAILRNDNLLPGAFKDFLNLRDKINELGITI